MKLSHLDQTGSAKMVDVSGKKAVRRTAVAVGKVCLRADTIRQLKGGLMKKGDALAAARIAGITAAKRTAYLIPLCHNIEIEQVSVDFAFEKDGLAIQSRAICTGKTGIEMEALTAVSVAALTIYDMCKAVDKTMTITDIHLVSKTGGKSPR